MKLISWLSKGSRKLWIDNIPSQTVCLGGQVIYRSLFHLHMFTISMAMKKNMMYTTLQYQACIYKIHIQGTIISSCLLLTMDIWKRFNWSGVIYNLFKLLCIGFMLFISAIRIEIHSIWMWVMNCLLRFYKFHQCFPRKCCKLLPYKPTHVNVLQCLACESCPIIYLQLIYFEESDSRQHYSDSENSEFKTLDF